MCTQMPYCPVKLTLPTRGWPHDACHPSARSTRQLCQRETSRTLHTRWQNNAISDDPLLLLYIARATDRSGLSAMWLMEQNYCTDSSYTALNSLNYALSNLNIEGYNNFGSHRKARGRRRRMLLDNVKKNWTGINTSGRQIEADSLLV